MTDRYAVFGNPLSHTKSPLIHMSFAQGAGEDIDYGKVEAPLDDFAGAIAAFRAGGGRGANVTLPFKLEACAIATTLMPRAKAAGAANCLKFEGEAIIAENFDGLGLVRDIEVNLGVPMKGLNVLLLGAGGAARGALIPFLEAAPGALTLVNRTVDKALGLRRDFAPYGAFAAGGYDALAGRSFDVVVNATSASLTGALPPVPPEVFDGAALAYDLVYGKGLTPFLTLARARGVPRLADGVGMLVEQAAEAFAWWRGVRPATRPVIDALTVPLV